MGRPRSDQCMFRDTVSRWEDNSRVRFLGRYHPHSVCNMKNTATLCMVPRCSLSELNRRGSNIG